MRPPREIRDRLRQELRNLVLWAAPPPRLSEQIAPAPLPLLPEPAKVAALLSGTSFPDELRSHARDILAHRFPLLGLKVETGREIRWRKDYVNGPETGASYFRLVPYLDAARAGDHKVIWELNRHQHLVLLAQLYWFDADPALLTEIWSELESWMDANPFARGINWASALEVAFRALSWTWIYHLTGRHMPPRLRGRFFESLERHGRFIEVNLSFYFSPNTHLLGEAVALHALGALFPVFPRAARWREIGAEIVNAQLERQVRTDGAHFEQSSYYHVYALDMFLFHGILARAGKEYREKIALMADYLAAIQGPSRTLPFIGDDDGGRFFYPFGCRRRFARATLATCAAWLGASRWSYDREDLFALAAWWIGCADGSARAPLRSRLFAESGMAVMTAGDRHILIDAGPFGPWGSGHSHSDTLSIVARAGDREILIDPGTYTYVGDAAARNWFRGSAAHNTLRIDGLDQAAPVNPFRWKDQPKVILRDWKTTETGDFLDTECAFSGFFHRRRVHFLKPDLLFIVDAVSGLPGEHEIEQFWHLDSAEDRPRIATSDPAELISDFRSDAFASRKAGVALHVRKRSQLPATMAAALDLGAADRELTVECAGDFARLIVNGRELVHDSA